MVATREPRHCVRSAPAAPHMRRVSAWPGLGGAARRALVPLLAVAAAGACSVLPPQPQPVGTERTALPARTGVPVGPLDQLTWAIPADVTELDPLAARDEVTRMVLANVCESLLRQQPDGSIGPGIATPRRVSATAWSYEIRPDARFSDGSPVLAADVVYSLTRATADGSPWAEELAAVKGVQASDQRTVVVTLSSPDVLVNELLATAAGAVVSSSATRRVAGSPREAAVCSGPYVVDSWRKGREVTLRRVEGYAHSGRPHPLASTVVLRVAPGASDRVDALLGGRVQGTYDPPAHDTERLRDSPGTRVTTGQGTAAVSLAVTHFDGPLRDVRLRRALALGVDRDALVAAAPVAGARPAKAPAAVGQWATPTSDGSAWYVNLPPVRYSVEDARRLVVEAGVPNEPIYLAAGPDPLTRAVAAEVKQATVLTGLPIKVVELSAAEFDVLRRDPAARPDIDGYVQVDAPEVAEPLLVYRSFCGPDALVVPGFDQRAYREVCARALAEPSRARRLQLVDQLQKMAVGAYLWVPLFEQPSVVAERTDITGTPAGYVRTSMPWAALVGAAR